VGEVLGDQGLADAVGSDQDDVGGAGEPVETEEVVDLLAVDLLGPAPVEVGQRLEGAEPGAAQAALEAAAAALLFLPGCCLSH